MARRRFSLVSRRPKDEEVVSTGASEEAGAKKATGSDNKKKSKKKLKLSLSFNSKSKKKGKIQHKKTNDTTTSSCTCVPPPGTSTPPPPPPPTSPVTPSTELLGYGTASTSSTTPIIQSVGHDQSDSCGGYPTGNVESDLEKANGTSKNHCKCNNNEISSGSINSEPINIHADEANTEVTMHSSSPTLFTSSSSSSVDSSSSTSNLQDQQEHEQGNHKTSMVMISDASQPVSSSGSHSDLQGNSSSNVHLPPDDSDTPTNNRGDLPQDSSGNTTTDAATIDQSAAAVNDTTNATSQGGTEAAATARSSVESVMELEKIIDDETNNKKKKRMKLVRRASLTGLVKRDNSKKHLDTPPTTMRRTKSDVAPETKSLLSTTSQMAAAPIVNAGGAVWRVSAKAGNAVKDVSVKTSQAVVNTGAQAGQVVVGAGTMAGKTVVGAGTAVVNTGAKAGQAVVNTGAKAGQVVVGAGTMAGKTVVGAGTAVVNTGAKAGQAVVNTGAKAGQAVVGAGTIAGKTVVGAGTAVVNTGAKAGQAVVNTSAKAGQAVVGAGTMAGQAVVGAGTAVVNTGAKAGQVVVGAGAMAGQAVVGAGTMAGQAVVGAGTAVVNTGAKAGQAVVNTSAKAGQVVVGAGKAAHEAVVDVGTVAGKAVVDASTMANQVVVGTGAAVVGAGAKAGQAVVGVGTKATKSVVGAGTAVVGSGLAVVGASTRAGQAVVGAGGRMVSQGGRKLAMSMRQVYSNGFGIRSSRRKKSSWEEGIEVIDQILDPSGPAYAVITEEQRSKLANVKKFLLKGPGNGDDLKRQHVPQELLQIQDDSALFDEDGNPLANAEQKKGRQCTSNFLLQEYGGISRMSRADSMDDLSNIESSNIESEDESEDDEDEERDQITVLRPSNLTLSSNDGRPDAAKEEDDDDVSISLYSHQTAHTARRMFVLDKHYLPREFTYLDCSQQVELCQMLSWESLMSWDFDIFRLNEITNGHPLLFMSWAIISAPYAQEAMARELNQSFEANNSCGYNFMEEFSIPAHKLCNYMRTIEGDYNANPYHNEIHAADVMQTTHTMIQKAQGEDFMQDVSRLKLFALLLAAAVHDVQHQGKTNAFHVKLRTELAVNYNDNSVLENHHVAQAFARMLNLDLKAADNLFDGQSIRARRNFVTDEKRDNNILCNVTSSQFEKIRKLMIDAVLHTDMTKHFAMVNEVRGMLMEEVEEEKEKREERSWRILTFMLHMCDISGQAKGSHLFRQWGERCMEEFFLQGDEEKGLGMSISPNCDRQTVVIAESQVGFMRFVVEPSYEVLGQHVSFVAEQVLPIIHDNLDYWCAEQEGISLEEFRQGMETVGEPSSVEDQVEVVTPVDSDEIAVEAEELQLSVQDSECEAEQPLVESVSVEVSEEADAEESQAAAEPSVEPQEDDKVVHEAATTTESAEIKGAPPATVAATTKESTEAQDDKAEVQPTDTSFIRVMTVEDDDSESHGSVYSY